MKILLWIATALLVVSVYFTDLMSDSPVESGLLPIVSIVLLLVVVVAAFAVLFEREQTREQDLHVTVERDQKGQMPRRIPKGANVETGTNTVESTRTITYVDGKKVEDSYQEKRR